MIQIEVTRHFLPPQKAKAFIKPVTDNNTPCCSKKPGDFFGASQAWEASHLHNTSETQQLPSHCCRSLNRLGADLRARINFTPVSTALNKDCPMQAGYPVLSNWVQHGMVAQEPSMKGIQGAHGWGHTGWQQPRSLILLLYSHSPPCQTQSTLGSSSFKDKIQSTRLHIERGERTTAVHRPSDNALPSYHSGSTAWKSENKQQEN